MIRDQIAELEMRFIDFSAFYRCTIFDNQKKVYPVFWFPSLQVLIISLAMQSIKNCFVIMLIYLNI